MKPSHGHNERLLHRERETLASVFNKRDLIVPVLIEYSPRISMPDNELTSVSSPSNIEPLQFQISCGGIGISERTEVSTESALQGCFGVKHQTQRLKKLIWNFLHSSALKKYDNQ